MNEVITQLNLFYLRNWLEVSLFVWITTSSLPPSPRASPFQNANVSSPHTHTHTYAHAAVTTAPVDIGSSVIFTVMYADAGVWSGSRSHEPVS